MSFCINCGTKNNDAAAFCVNCGSPLRSRPDEGWVCWNCGNVMKADTRFCCECGAEREKRKKESGPVCKMVTKDHPYRHPGGTVIFWAGLFFFGAAALAVFSVFAVLDVLSVMGEPSYAELLGDGFRILCIYMLVYFITVGVLGCTGLIRSSFKLLTKDHTFLRSFNFWAILVGAVAAGGLAGMWFVADKFVPYNVFTGEFMIIIILAGVALLILIVNMYSARSVRLRTYMGTPLYLIEGQFTKNTLPPEPVVPDERKRRTL